MNRRMFLHSAGVSILGAAAAAVELAHAKAKGKKKKGSHHHRHKRRRRHHPVGGSLLSLGDLLNLYKKQQGMK